MRLTSLTARVALGAACMVASGGVTSPVAAQEPASSLAGLPVHGGAASPLPGLERPSDVVARLARQALAAPDDSSAWKALAGALPDLALSGAADLEGTFEAARLADSLSVALGVVGAPGADPQGPSSSRREPSETVEASGNVAALVSWWPPALSVQLMGGTLFGALALAGILVARARRRARHAAVAPMHHQHADRGRLWTARTLATGGIAVPEIAKRTGMAQEAVNLALSLGGNAPAAPASRKRGPTPSAATRSAMAAGAPGGPSRPAEERIRREVMAGVGRLRDRRLTYGGGAAT